MLFRGNESKASIEHDQNELEIIMITKDAPIVLPLTDPGRRRTRMGATKLRSCPVIIKESHMSVLEFGSGRM